MTLPVPPFNADGLLPPGRHQATIDEIRSALVDPLISSTRTAIFESWLLHREALKNVVPVLYEWVDGSFVTDKADPGDMDVVTFVDGPTFDLLPLWRRVLGKSLLLGHDNRSFWRVDSFALVVVPATDPRRPAYDRDIAYWDDWWGKVRGTTDRKGYLEVTP